VIQMDQPGTEQIMFGKWLRQKRRMLDLTQEALADQAGCARITLRRIENGMLKPSRNLAFILLEKVGIPETDRAKWVPFARGLADLPADPSVSFAARTQTNLPACLTTFIGRKKEQAVILGLITKHRLVTLTGAGGVGKTRLSLKVGELALGDFANGIWLVELASLSDPALLPQSIAALFGVTAQSNACITESLIHFLRAKSTLLILDNCEHLLDACAQLTGILLKNCPNLKILTTSREPLGITGEAVYRVPSLGLPDIQQVLEKIREYESVRLFVERAQLAQTDLSLTMENASSIVQICCRLDGIPLAIELAAARVNMFSTEQIAGKLNESFNLLTGGSRIALPRQQTLRALIDWSYDLLSESERLLLLRLAVFAGGWTLELAEQVCSDERISQHEVLDMVGRLLDKSLVVIVEGGMGTRYRMLETVRQYAREKLFELGEEEKTRDQHLKAFTKLAEKAEPEIRSSNQLIWLDRLDEEINNLRAALEWAQERDDESFLRLASALWRFWIVRGYVADLEWLPKALDATKDLQTILRARALGRASYISSNYVDLQRGRIWAKEAEILSRALGDKPGLAMALTQQGDLETNYAQGLALLEQALTLTREIGDQWWAEGILMSRAGLFLNRNDLASARSIFEHALKESRSSGDKVRISFVLMRLGLVALAQGDVVQAEKLFREALTVAQIIRVNTNIWESHWGIIVTKIFLEDYPAAKEMITEDFRFAEIDKACLGETYLASGWIDLAQGDVSRAIEQMKEGLILAKQTTDQYTTADLTFWMGEALRRKGDFAQAIAGYKDTVAIYQEEKIDDGYCCLCLEGLGMLAIDRGQAVRGARLLGARERLRASGFTRDFFPFMVRERELHIAAAREQLGEDTFCQVWAEGKAMSTEDALKFALMGIK
jgi:predicted ATPase/DNA-binding XRE family transcriptional regulator